MNVGRIFEEFPAPSYRGHQEETLARIKAAFEAGNDVVLVRAPTGSGKSLLARAVAGCADRPSDDGVTPADPVGAYYTTPQVSQLDDVAADDLLDDLNVIRGKNNYTCILPGEESTPVDRAPCVRERGYDCSVKHRCPYFSDRAIASNRQIAAMTLAYFMRTAGSEVFRKRDVCVIDEAHGLGEWAEMYATVDLGPRTVPVWEDLRVPEVEGLDDVADWVERLQNVCRRRKDDLLAVDELDPAEAAERDRLQELVSELEWFLEDYRDPDSATTWLVDQSDGTASKGPGGPVAIKPMNPERYLKHTVWDRANKFVLLSATILDKAAFCHGTGLDPDDVALVAVDHTFPLEHRPLYDVTCGKMTYEHRDDTIPDLARTVVRLMQRHRSEKGLVHCHSYAIQSRLVEHFEEMGVGGRVRAHDRDDRDAQLAAWKDRDAPELFLSVKMEEALDLEGDLARWQVLCKAPYPNTNDPRVAHRLQDDQWGWYYRATLRTVIQACGRVVRSPEDHGATYLADESLLDVFDRARGVLPEWFRDQVDRMGRPDLPEFDPDAAVGRTGGSVTGGATTGRRGTGGGASGRSSASATGTSAATSSGAAKRTNEGGSDGDDGSSDGGASGPVADVWDTE